MHIQHMLPAWSDPRGITASSIGSPAYDGHGIAQDPQNAQEQHHEMLPGVKTDHPRIW